MKKTFITLLALAGVAGADDIVLTLPSYVTTPVSQTKGLSSMTIDRITTNVTSYGFYVGGNDGNVVDAASWGSPAITVDSVTYKEGTWNNDILTLAGRGGVGGLGAAFVFGNDIAAGTTLTDITFSAQGYESNPLSGSISLELALRDASGNRIEGIADVKGISFNSKSEELTSIKLDGSVTWQAGYKIYGIIRGLSVRDSGATTAYIIDGISASATVIPEPTTATLSLLALVGLAARRRRK